MDITTSKLLLGASAGGGDPVYVDDVFSTFLYTGTSSNQTMVNGIDLSTEGGLVWLKARSQSYNHFLFDTERGPTKGLRITTDAEITLSDYFSSFNSDGFTVGSNGTTNYIGVDFASWSFRKAPKFFDVVTFTGTGSVQNISHSLGSVPGMIIIRCRVGIHDWEVYHRSSGPTRSLHLNQTDAANSDSSVWNDTAPTATHFTVGTSGNVNQSGHTYIAYIFAHDEQSFGTDNNEAIIKCGSYVGTGASGFPGNKITLGFEPQFLLIKNIDSGGTDWEMLDSTRGMFSDLSNGSPYLRAGNQSAEFTNDHRAIDLDPDGFQVQGSNTSINGTSGNNFIYMAIRRPHKPPGAGTDVFDIQSHTSDAGGFLSSSTVTGDAVISFAPDSSSYNNIMVTRLLGKYLKFNTNSASADTSKFDYAQQTGVNRDDWFGTQNFIDYTFSRAPGFFDVVSYSGHQYKRPSESYSDVPHSLGVVPEMIWIKPTSLSGTNSKWVCYHKDLGTSSFLFLNEPSSTSGTNYFGGNAPTSSVFTLFAGGFTQVDYPPNEYIAYLFASLDGVSKVGSYSGTGSDQNIDCGFTNGARFVLIRRTDTGDSWHLFDTTQGIQSGNDPYWRLNTLAAQVTSNDFIDPLSSGFKLVTNDGGINAYGATYIFYAIA